MGLQLVYPAAVGGKRPVSKKTRRTSEFFVYARRLTCAAVAFFMTSLAAPASYAQSGGPYAGMAGKWAGSGTVTLDDGSNERIRCRAVYDVASVKMEMSLTCASDAYKFNFAVSVVDQGGAIVGSWSETSRGITGSLQGRGGGGTHQSQRSPLASTPTSRQDNRQQADRQHPRRQPVQGRQYFAVEIDRRPPVPNTKSPAQERAIFV